MDIILIKRNNNNFFEKLLNLRRSNSQICSNYNVGEISSRNRKKVINMKLFKMFYEKTIELK